MNPYDIERIFAEIEENIIKKMIDRFKTDRAKGKRGSYKWQDWRLKQLNGIKNFIKSLRGDYEDTYKELNSQVADKIEESFDDSLRDSIRQAREHTTSDRFSEINRSRMEALRQATTDDLERVEGAVFRKTEDSYRQIIYKAEVGLNSGLYTYDQAVDVATKDFLNAGINCIEYKNGSRHTVHEYAKMVLRTNMKRAGLMADGEVRRKLGVHTVYAHWRDEACPECMEFLGRLMIDDVYSGGTREEAESLNCILLSEAMEQGFLHPNCKDTISTYFPYLYEDDPESDPLLETATHKEMYEAKKREEQEEKIYNAETNIKKYTQLAKNQLDNSNKQRYNARKNEWEDRLNELLEDLDELDERAKALAGTTDETFIYSENDRAEIESVYGIVVGDPMTFQEADSGKVNPGFVTKGSPYWDNCQTSVLVYDARRKGLKVEAMPYEEYTQSTYLAENPTYGWLDENGEYPDVKRLWTTTNKATVEKLDEIVAEGSRYMFKIERVGESGHVIVVERLNGKLLFYDPQSNELYIGKSNMANALDREYNIAYEDNGVDISPWVLRLDSLSLNLKEFGELMIPVNE